MLTIGSKGAYTTGKITEEQRLDVVRHACPGPGACGGMYTCATNWFILTEQDATMMRPMLTARIR
jgi:dihydroxyacid dehydratase/phosphogluconate dehydratase